MFTVSGFEQYKIGSQTDLAKVSGKDLLAMYNKLTGKSTTKFASRGKGEQQVWGALQENGTKVAKTNGATPPTKKVSGGKPARTRGVFNLPADAKVQQHREGTKRATVIDLLGRPEGATLEEVQKATGWDAKTAYDGVRLLHTYLGYGLKTSAEGRIHLVRPK